MSLLLPELLCPAGDEAALRAAVDSGANAVYLGYRVFGARASATNFDAEALEAAVRYAHLYHVRVYVTVNTLVKPEEMRDLRAALGDIAVTSDKSCVIACTARIAPLLSDELVRVARDTVKTELFADSDFTTVREFEKSDITVSSMRFDCIVKALCRVSREEAQRLVSSGLCTLEWLSLIHI